MRTYGLGSMSTARFSLPSCRWSRGRRRREAAGFDGVEFWWPWAGMVPSDAEADAFVRSIGDAGVELVSLNFHAGDMAAGERGILSHPGRAAEFREHIAACVEIAGRAGCTRLNAPYGLRAAGVDHDTQESRRHRQSSARRGGCG